MDNLGAKKRTVDNKLGGGRTTITMSRGSPINYLKRWKDKRTIVILPDNITVMNFEYAVEMQGASKSFKALTLEELAKGIIAPLHPYEHEELDASFMRRLMMETISKASSGPLMFFKGIELETREAQEALMNEFEEYIRCADISRLHGELKACISGLENPFAKMISERSVDAFRALEEELSKNAKLLGNNVYLSRLYLLSSAVDKLAKKQGALRDIEAVIVSSIPMYDANALRFLLAVHDECARSNECFEMVFFQGIGTFERMRTRLKNANVKFSSDEKDTGNRWLYAIKGEERPKDIAPELIAVPDRRREVEEAARRIYKLLNDGKVHPSEILIVARNCGRYLELVSEIFPFYGIPVYVQTRRPYAHLTAYRFLKYTFDLIAKIEKGEMLEWHDITDPLRLGFCLPGKSGWPLGANDFIYIEEKLSYMQAKMQAKKMNTHINDWMTNLKDGRFANSMSALKEFLEWAMGIANKRPNSPDEAAELVADLLHAFSENNFAWVHKTPIPLMMNKERYDLSRLHPTHFSNRMRKERHMVKEYIEETMRTSPAKLDWALVAQAIGEMFGLRTYGLQHDDLCCVKMTDIGTSSFLEAKHLFMLGMKADEFPRKFPEGAFLHNDLRKALDVPSKGKGAFLYLRGHSSDYDNELDLLEFALNTAKGNVYFFMPYLDEKGHVSDWSSFVDQDLAAHSKPVPPDRWLPDVANADNGTLSALPPRERMRLFCSYSKVKYPHGKMPISADKLDAIGRTVDKRTLEERIEPRIKRFVAPPREIVVKPTEKWLAQLTLADIAGSPFRAHEMDMHAFCPFKFYFYQFLFALDGNKINRDFIPNSKRWRFGRLPMRLSHLHPPTYVRNAIGCVLETWGDRQGKLHSMSEQKMIQELKSIVGGYHLQFKEELLKEKSLVKQELRDKITRKWTWVKSGKEIVIDANNGLKVIVPDHRRDEVSSETVQGPKGYLLFAHLSYSMQIDKVYYKQPRYIPTLNDASKTLREYRLPILFKFYKDQNMKVVGGIYDELYSGDRKGYYLEDSLRMHKGTDGYEEELEMNSTDTPSETKKQLYSSNNWSHLQEIFERALIERASEMSPKPEARYIATPSERACCKCTYKELCHIPRLEGF